MLNVGTASFNIMRCKLFVKDKRDLANEVIEG